MTCKITRFALAVATSCLCLAVAQPASASLLVYDPTNYTQTVLTAARSLQQINNQIQQIENQAQQLINEAKNLAALPTSTLATLEAQIDRTRQLLQQAQRIAYSVTEIGDAFEGRYAGAAMTASNTQMSINAKDRWNDSVAAFEDSLKTGATLVSNLSDTRTSVSTLVSASQSATGALQAAQAGNQLMGLQTQQLADLTAAITAQARAQALNSANGTATQGEGQERFKRFLGED